ncbi:hypothetical protein NECAME_14923 [Necator americanus]|uniref:Uncharacterized protein n=1 Tax=Necator americanus TaxID=51031 RepID=W2SMX9_NECAM|nr:hypothetical protein NECAME_14923 [Necator americanus]ETN70211.1 hypothetical protein NECAME_14923 [Necator americanus]
MPDRKAGTSPLGWPVNKRSSSENEICRDKSGDRRMRLARKKTLLVLSLLDMQRRLHIQQPSFELVAIRFPERRDDQLLDFQGANEKG